MAKISVIHPSYGRPKLAEQTRRRWIERAGMEIEYILCLAESDPLLNDYQFPYIVSDHANMVKQMNLAASYARGDIIVATSDDFDCPENWAVDLLNVGKGDCVVKTVDGIQPDIVTLPIMSREYYERFGYIYHPSYGHFYGDEELFEVANRDGKLIRSSMVFEHIHHAAKKAPRDATNVKNSTHFKKDKLTFISRKSLGFPV
jgi:hypothetical protein